MLEGISTLDDLDPSGRRVIVRADLNVPLEDGKVADDLRIEASVPTIRELSRGGAGVVVCSHLGRPKGEPVSAFSLRPVARRLGEVLGEDVRFTGALVGEDARDLVDDLEGGEVALLENLRFHPGETSNSDDFASALADLGDIYVNDAFGAAHRAHASVVGIAARLPAYAGRLLTRELDVLGQLLADPPSPFLAILGGAKVSDKLGVLENLLRRVDRLAVGGAMCFTFLEAEGYDVGGSRVEHDQVKAVGELVAAARARDVDVLLPTDVVSADSFAPDAAAETRLVEDGIPPGTLGLDIGPDTAAAFAAAKRSCAAVIIDGPMGSKTRGAVCIILN
jgi:phosphoglycerate kinase